MVHQFADLARVSRGQGPAEYREILAEGKYQSAIDLTVTNDDAIARDAIVFHPEVMAIMFDKHVPFTKTVWIKQDCEPLARSQFAFGVLSFNTTLTTACQCCATHVR